MLNFSKPKCFEKILNPKTFFEKNLNPKTFFYHKINKKFLSTLKFWVQVVFGY